MYAGSTAAESHRATHGRDSARVASVRSVAEDLKRVPLFSGLTQRQLRQLAKNFKDRRVPAGGRLPTQGEVGGGALFRTAEGEAAVIVDGTRVGTMGPGDHFGELAMISEG